MTPLIAIDPGANGAFAFRDDQGRVWTESMPDTPTDILQLLVCHGTKHIAVIERVGTYVPGNSATAAVKFARHCGHLDMALIAAGISSSEVAPSVWMKALGALPKDKAERKRTIKDMMQRRYPNTKVTLANADALGILTWVMEKHG